MVLALSSVLTYLAEAPSLARDVLGIFFSPRMSALAGFSFPLARVTTAIILAASHRLKVVWVHTPTVAAKMIYVETLGNRSDKQLVGDAVRSFHPSSTTSDPNGTVSVPVGGAGPLPATILLFVDLLHETIDQGHCFALDARTLLQRFCYAW